jgi:ferredoxin-NADP reductase
VQATARTRIITVDLRGVSFPFSAGQAVLVGLAESAVTRPYSIACSPRQAREMQGLELLVQIDDHAAPDPHLEQAVPGTPLRLSGPFGSFGLPRPMPERRLLLIAGGTGIAPLRSMLWDALERRAVDRIALVYSARGPAEFAFLDEFRQLAASGQLDLHLTITRDGAAEWGGRRGRVDAALIDAAIDSPETRCLICGPPTLVTDAVALLKSAGVPEHQVGWETFTA